MPPDSRTAPVLPPAFAATRQSLHVLACFVLAPARLARTGRIGLRPITGGFGTPPFDDGSCIAVRGTELVREPGGTVAITTLRAAARFVDLDLVPDPAVGKDLPLFEPDHLLAVEPESARLVADWYAVGAAALTALRSHLEPSCQVSEAQIWPEHFDLASDVSVSGRDLATVGFSPGDAFCPEPYVYLSPRQPHRPDAFWNAPFGVFRRAEEIAVPVDFLHGAVQRLR